VQRALHARLPRLLPLRHLVAAHAEPRHLGFRLPGVAAAAWQQGAGDRRWLGCSSASVRAPAARRARQRRQLRYSELRAATPAARAAGQRWRAPRWAAPPASRRRPPLARWHTRPASSTSTA
jgi:hypothetical protein